MREFLDFLEPRLAVVDRFWDFFLNIGLRGGEGVSEQIWVIIYSTGENKT